MKQEERYIQPQNTREALLLIQKLFNSYRNAPLTQELLSYHNNLIFRLGSDIHDAAVKEGQETQLEDLSNLSAAMRRWTTPFWPAVQLQAPSFQIGQRPNAQVQTSGS